MALTRAIIEQILIRRVGTLLTAVGLDGTNKYGNNKDLNDPIGWALRQAGYTVASPIMVADTDIDDVADADHDKIFDLAELRALMTIEGNFDLTDLKVGPRSETWSKIGQLIADKIDRVSGHVMDIYGIGLASVETDILEHDFAQHYNTDGSTG